MSALAIAVERLPHGRDLGLPRAATAEAAGLDLLAAVTTPVRLEPGRRAAVPTGLRLAIPSGFEGQIRPRSGLALRHGVTVVNAPGTIDTDFRGELMVALINLGDAGFVVERGMRIAQIVFAPIVRARWVERSLAGDAPRRGAGGFGSTGFTAETTGSIDEGEPRE